MKSNVTARQVNYVTPELIAAYREMREAYREYQKFLRRRKVADRRWARAQEKFDYVNWERNEAIRMHRSVTEINRRWQEAYRKNEEARRRYEAARKRLDEVYQKYFKAYRKVEDIFHRKDAHRSMLAPSMWTETMRKLEEIYQKQKGGVFQEYRILPLGGW